MKQVAAKFYNQDRVQEGQQQGTLESGVACRKATGLRVTEHE
jgi:hypothetical protein